MKKTRGYIIAVHIICWLIFLSLPAVFVAGQSGNMRFASLIRPSGWISFSIYLFIFYLHTNLLFPKLYLHKKYVLYFLSVLLLAAAVFYIRPFERLAHVESANANWEHEDRMDQPGKSLDPALPGQMNFGKPATTSAGDGGEHRRKFRPRIDIISITLFFLIIALSITISVIKRWRIAVEQTASAEADKTNAELAILKAQINPHFLFNTLNNIYSQAVTHDEKTAESIMKLSNIMRYLTDDANETFVSLISETNFISDYIELQRLRLGSKVTLDFAVKGNLTDKVIAPLILITFIENVFKYGISNSEPTIISIDLRVYADSIGFFCRNKSFPLKNHLESTGIGIINTRKRLEHLYPGKHSLTIREEDGFYSVHLILKT